MNQRIAGRVRELRAASELSLDALASKSGVSRSMISLIERGESSPTAVVLEKLASGLGVVLASLFDAPSAAPSPLARHAEQPCWRDPGSGYLRRNVSPVGSRQRVRIVEVQFPPGARVAFENAGQDAAFQQQVWVLEGAMFITVGADSYQLRAGDCLAMQLDKPTMFHNATGKPARYAVIIAPEGATRR